MAGTRRVATPIRANISITPGQDGQVAEAHPWMEKRRIFTRARERRRRPGGDILGGIADQGLLAGIEEEEGHLKGKEKDGGEGEQGIAQAQQGAGPEPLSQPVQFDCPHVLARSRWPWWPPSRQRDSR